MLENNISISRLDELCGKSEHERFDNICYKGRNYTFYSEKLLNDSDAKTCFHQVYHYQGEIDDCIIIWKEDEGTTIATTTEFMNIGSKLQEIMASIEHKSLKDKKPNGSLKDLTEQAKLFKQYFDYCGDESSRAVIELLEKIIPILDSNANGTNCRS